MATVKENSIFSNRVIFAQFDSNWSASIIDGYVVYTATVNNAKVNFLDTTNKKLVSIKKGGQIWVGGGGTTHVIGPHVTTTL